MSVRSRVGKPVRRILGDQRTRTVVAAEQRWRHATALALAPDLASKPMQHPAGPIADGDLTQLAIKFKTDKWGIHRYAPHYERHLEHLRSDPVVLLEIGVGGYRRAGEGGASLRMWKSYFPSGAIYGLDIRDKSFVDEPRIKTFRGSQTNEKKLRAIIEEIGRPDVIIDDGSHRPAHIVATFAVLFPLLADDGIYVVEDTQTSYWPEWGGSEDLDDPDTSMAFLKRLADGLNHEEFLIDDYQATYADLNVTAVHFYHNLVFVQKGSNQEGTRKRKILKERYPDG